jgi:excisionase family DNA binding protein
MSGTEWLGPKDVSDELHIPIKTVYQWNSKGIGPRAAKIGRHVRYRRADVEAWIEQQYATPSPAA